ncbi:MAG: WG repeat-containing protein [Prevotellaceae bacterium]|jgi:hypothetical protein|nr:WG repeat-containing protein [Prevotellaceae bacterium]
MKRLLFITFCLFLMVASLSAQSGYVFSTEDQLKQSKELFDKLNKNRIDGDTFEYLLSTSDNEVFLPKNQNGYFVYIDTRTGKQKPKGEFDKAYPFNGQFALVVKEGKRGIINQSGRWVIKPTDPLFDQLEEKGMYLDVRDGKFDYILYEDLGLFPYSPFKQNGKWGIITHDPLKPVIPYEYDAIIALDMNGFIALKDKRLGYVRLKDNKPLSTFEHVRLTYTKVENGFNDLHYFALYDMEAEVWDYYMSDYNGLKKLFSTNQYSFNYNMGEYGVAKLKIGDKYNVFFSDGSILPKSYKWITDLPSRQLILAVDDEDRIVIVNRRGDEFVVCE